jgi:hypothetical protein
LLQLLAQVFGVVGVVRVSCRFSGGQVATMRRRSFSALRVGKNALPHKPQQLLIELP